MWLKFLIVELRPSVGVFNSLRHRELSPSPAPWKRLKVYIDNLGGEVKEMIGLDIKLCLKMSFAPFVNVNQKMLFEYWALLWNLPLYFSMVRNVKSYLP